MPSLTDKRYPGGVIFAVLSLVLENYIRTVGGYYIAHFADKYCSEVSKFLWTQMSQKVAVAFIFVVFVFARHKSSNQTYMVCTYVHTYVHMYIHFKFVFQSAKRR